MKLRYPKIPLTVVAFDETRSYISADAPGDFDRALADFLAGRPVPGKTGHRLPRDSARAAVMQAVGGVKIRIAYGRPAVRERKVWGELVPYGRVWRAGANEATTSVVNRDVTIDGHALAAGTYTFFAIPGDTEWTLIFNRVPRQWGGVRRAARRRQAHRRAARRASVVHHRARPRQRGNRRAGLGKTQSHIPCRGEALNVENWR